MLKRLALLPLAALLLQGAHAATTTFLILNDSHQQMGEQVVERHDDGRTTVKFSYKNNGRGPELTEQFRLGPDLRMSEYQVTGNSTFGAAVDERFVRTGDLAEWTTTSDRGSVTLVPADTPATYVPLNSSFEVVSNAITALAASKDGTISLLPTGTLRQTRLETAEVTDASGKKQAVQLLALTGIGLSPSFYWATTGDQPRLFAVIIPGFLSLLEPGWQGAMADLARRQKAAEAQLLTDVAVKLQQPLTGLTVVRNARVFDSETATVGKPSDIYVLRGRITAVLAAGSPARAADNTLDAAGRIVLPGLFDMHGHVDRWSGALNISTGVTSVRDMGNDNLQLQAMLDETAAGKLLAPQVVPAGFLEGESGYSASGGFLVRDLQGAKDAIDWYAQRGYPQLKIYNSFPQHILKDTVAYAHGRGMRVSGHVPAGLRAQQALDAGYDEIQHINQVMLNFFVQPDTETRNLNRFVLPAEKVADLDLTSKPVRDFVARLAKQQTVIDPTLAAFAFLKQRDGDVNEPYAAFAEHMPPDVRRGFSVGTMKIPPGKQGRYEKSYQKMVDFVGILYRAGVPIVAGTDDVPGFTLHSELALLVKAGLTPAQALQVATRNGARYTRTSNDRGSIVAGKLADLVLVDGDPTRNIEDVRRVSAVITRGFLIYPHQVDAALGIRSFVSTAPPVVVTAAGGQVAEGGGNDGARYRLEGSARKHD